MISDKSHGNSEKEMNIQPQNLLYLFLDFLRDVQLMLTNSSWDSQV